MIQRASIPPRGPRHGGPSRGGVSKRRAGPVRVDKDGDLVMDSTSDDRRKQSGKGRINSPAPPSGPKGAGRGRGAPSRGGNLGTHKVQAAIIRGLGAQQANVLESRITTGGTTLKIDGLKSSKAAANPDGGLEALLAFLERKAAGLDSKSNRSVKIKKSHMKGDSVIITASPEDIEAILKLNTFSFAGTPLAIQACDPESPPRSFSKEVKRETKEKFKAILATRYNGDLKLLSLSALAQDPGLLEMGLGNFDGKTANKLFPAMMVVCDQFFKSWQAKRDAIVSVSLANNGLTNVTHVTSLARTFPDIKNLDLSSNNISDLKSLIAWRWKFRNLENLVLTDNPIVTQVPDFNVDIMKWYPKLQVLNGIQVRTPEEIAALIEAANSPIPISGPDFRDVGQVGENFVRAFVSLYDTNRAALLSNYYDSQSLFSLNINMSAPRDREHSTAVPAWAAYIKHSRNLVRLNHLGPRMNRQYRGIQAIQSTWSDLPATRHPDLTTEPTKYMIECHSLPGLADPTGQTPGGVDGLIINLHGEFEEQNSTTDKAALRSFSRTFILGPGGPGSPQIRIVSDMLTLRAHSPLAKPSHSNRGASPQPNIVAEPTEQQKQEILAKQLMERTGMTVEYAVMCLGETGWDLEQAFAAFQANKDKLPPNAFIAGVAQ